MKRIVLTFGLISGAVLSLMMAVSILLIDRIGFDKGMIIGYTTMILSFLLVFFGIRSYRENVGGGSIGFGKAFQIGILITIISCLCYVVTWQILYFNFIPDFLERYGSYVIEELRASGASQEAIDAKTQELKTFGEYYKNPLINAAFTFLEPFPVGLLVTLLSSLLLRKRRFMSDKLF